MSYIFSAEAKKNLAISCACFGAAAVAGVGLIVSNLNKTPEQVGKSNDQPVEVPYTSSVKWEDLDISKELIVAEEGEESARLGAEQFAAFAAEQTSNKSNSSIAPKPTQPETPAEPTEPEEPEEPDYLLELGLQEEGVIYMQDVTPEMIEEMDYGDTLTVVDNRTGYSYEVYKDYAGNRWSGATLYMKSDLKLGSAEKPMLLTPAHSNVYNNYVLPAATEPKEYNINNSIEESVAIDGDSYLYSPAAALAGSQFEDFGDDIVIYNSSESICPAGWRLPMNSEDFNNSDGMSESDFGSEVGNMVYHLANETSNWDLPDIPYASSTLREGYDYNDETDEYYSLGATMGSYSLSGFFDIPLNSSSITHVRCVYGESNIVRTNLTVDFNGATLDVDDWNGTFSVARVEHYKTWRNDYILPGYWLRRDGYKFLGYSKDKNASTPEYYDDGTYDHYIKLSDVLTNNTTIYAIWKKMRMITLDANGGSNWQGDSWNITFDEDGSILNGGYDEPRWAGHVFMGWALSPDATEVEYVYYDENNEIPTIWETTGDLTFYAVWGQE